MTHKLVLNQYFPTKFCAFRMREFGLTWADVLKVLEEPTSVKPGRPSKEHGHDTLIVSNGTIGVLIGLDPTYVHADPEHKHPLHPVITILAV